MGLDCCRGRLKEVRGGVGPTQWTCLLVRGHRRVHGTYLSSATKTRKIGLSRTLRCQLLRVPVDGVWTFRSLALELVDFY